MFADSKFLGYLSAGLDAAAVPAGAKLIVAFSGGPDSSALLAGLAELRRERNFTLFASHVNHQIRPDASRRYQDSASRISESLGIDFEAPTVDVPALAAASRISIETAARTARYEVLAQAVTRYEAVGVVTGHTRDDQAETVLLHASRGSGLKGIAGMSFNSTLRIPDNDIELKLFRPMLDTPRAECIEYCKKVGIKPVTDDSNTSRAYTRNRLRLDILPLLNEAIPEASRALARLAKNSSSDLDIINWVVDKYLIAASHGSGVYARFTAEHLPDGLVARMLMKGYESHVGHSHNLERTHISGMVRQLSGRSGTSTELPNGVEFYVDKESFGFRSNGDDDCPYPVSLKTVDLELPGITEVGDGVTINARIIDRPENLNADDSHITFATPALLTQSLRLRSRVNGDRFQPLGMRPQVKLQDFFVGAGVPERWRNRVPIVESENGIIWVAGYRLAEWAKVRPEHDQVTRLELAGAGPRTGA